MAAPVSFNPLSPADYRRIRDALTEAEQAQVYLDKLATLGHPVDGHQTSLSAAKQYLTMVLEQFPEASATA